MDTLQELQDQLTLIGLQKVALDAQYAVDQKRITVSYNTKKKNFNDNATSMQAKIDALNAQPQS